MDCIQKHHNKRKIRNEQLAQLANTMKSWSTTSGDHHWQAALEIERLLMIENLQLVSARCRGDDEDTVALIEGDKLEVFHAELSKGWDATINTNHDCLLGDAIDQRYR